MQQKEDYMFTMNQIAPSNEGREPVIEASSLRSSDEPEHEGPATLPLSPKLRATLTALGMTEEAFSSWETFHVSPAHAMLCVVWCHHHTSLRPLLCASFRRPFHAILLYHSVNDHHHTHILLPRVHLEDGTPGCQEQAVHPIHSRFPGLAGMPLQRPAS